MSQSTPNQFHTHLRTLYAAYRSAPSIPAKTTFFSPACKQLCTPCPTYAAHTRDTIVRYLSEAATASSGISVIDDAVRASDANTKSYYGIEPGPDVMAGLYGMEDGFVRRAAFASVSALVEQAEREGWVSMSVVMWSDTGKEDEGVTGVERGLMVKVDYWWRREKDEDEQGEGNSDGTEEKWLQILHHITYLGPRDGSERDVREVLS